MKLSRTKLYMRLLFGALFMVLLAFCSSISLAASPADTLKQEPTINVPLSSWNELKGRLTIAESSINNSKQALQQANNLTATQGDELSKLKTINEKQGQELSDLKQIGEGLEHLDAARGEIERGLELIGRIERANQTQQTN